MAPLFTSRCLLQPPREHDRDGLIALATDPTVRRFLGGPRKDAVATASADALIVGSTCCLTWAVRLRDQNEAGCIGLVVIGPHHDDGLPELSYQFLPAYWGRGLALECTEAVRRHAFDTLRLPGLVSETQAANWPSRRLLTRIGMREVQTVERFGAAQIIYEIGNPQDFLRQKAAPAG